MDSVWFAIRGINSFLLHTLISSDCVRASWASPVSSTSCAADSLEIEEGDLPRGEGFVQWRKTTSSQSLPKNLIPSSDVLTLSSFGTDLQANLSTEALELLDLDIDVSVTSVDQMRSLPFRAFDAMAKKMRLDREYNTQELESFKNHFVFAVNHDVEDQRRKAGAWSRRLSSAEIKRFMRREMILQRPVITEKMVKDINRQNRGWVASVASDVGKLTVKDFAFELGYEQTNDAWMDSKPPESEKVTLLQASSELRSFADEPPENFDASAAWPECAKIIGLIPDQGKCASCWAITTVGVFNDRLCIASNGVFKAQLSVADVLACDRRNKGCQGGNPVKAVEFLQKVGTVTGSNYGQRGLGDSCFPYPVRNIDATKHFDSQVETPRCRSACSEVLYPRIYNKDKYFVAGKIYLIGKKFPHADPAKTKETWEVMKHIISTKGSIVMMYAVDKGHVAYESGFWDCPAGKANHMVRCIGYGVDAKHGKYIACVQSWGPSWGEEGRFRMKFPGNGCLEALAGIPVSWTEKNMQTGAAPASIVSRWSWPKKHEILDRLKSEAKKRGFPFR